MDEYYEAVAALPVWLARPLGQVPPAAAGDIHEIRLRAGCRLGFTIRGAQCPARQLDMLPAALRRLVLTQDQIEDIFYTLCGGSVHTHQAELAQGYLTLPGGHRVGVGGRYLARPREEDVLQTVASLNLRIARSRVSALPPALCEALEGHFTGLLVAGEPDCGKTTLLRSIACHLAQEGRAVAVIDERGELFPEQGSFSAADGVPPLDRIAGLPKRKALQMALRTLAPQVILLDELGGMEEAAALEQGFFSGVDFVASLHASGPEDALRRPQVRYMQQRGMVRVLAVLEGRRQPGQVKEVRLL